MSIGNLTFFFFSYVQQREKWKFHKYYTMLTENTLAKLLSGSWMNWCALSDEANMLKNVSLTHKSLPLLPFPSFHSHQPTHASCKWMKLCQGPHFHFTVQYKAINKTAWITVNNTSNMTNATWKRSQHAQRDSLPSLAADRSYRQETRQ